MTILKTIGVIGLGKMGRGMAASLKRAGFEVMGNDANHELTQTVSKEEGIRAADQASDIFKNCDAIVLSLPTSAIVRSLVEGSTGIAALAKPGTFIIDTTTAEPNTTKELARILSEKGIRFIDAPVSGGARGAATGELTMFLGGSKKDVEDATPVLSALGTKRFHIGEVGSGCVAKLANNMLTGINLLAASEVFRVAKAAGVNTENLIESINAGSGRSGVTLYNYPSRILNNAFDSGFTMQLMRKDIRLAVAMMQDQGLDLPMITNAGRTWAESASTLADAEDFNRIVQLDVNKG